ncbi:PBSX family phage terminase large subunit [uncultured Fusobacterium sp.]|uniref:PBSX family phage terminase large subunit n=1 Tax=uncultured Fusobacterium sp. TaxID=159267 RepID=UPI0025FC392F|nr:PBSX family phage terminase large subunit [uncultured Fusobacterium sp.]
MADIRKLFTEKQIELLSCSIHEKPKILVASGAKRAGKTYIMDIAFLKHMRAYKNKGVSFILGGATSATIRRNILNDLEDMLGMDIKLNKEQGFELWGNMIYCFGGSNADSWKAVRGFTAAGAFLNEGTALHDTFVKEVISRCSYEGARIFIDTNPENPMHSVKTDYIDKSGQLLSNGRLNIKAFNFTLYDNTFLPKDYVDSIEKATPTGMFYDRDIMGLWVAAEGIVYRDFDYKVHLVDNIATDETVIKYIGGVDFGYEHFGSIVVIALTNKGNYYLVEEIAEQHRYIEWWKEKALELQRKYFGIKFYCDTARPEYIDYLLKSDGENGRVEALKANKSVLEGIQNVGSLLKQHKLFFIRNKFKKGLQEMYLYTWSDKVDDEKVKKENDDVLDALRYAVMGFIQGDLFSFD